MLILTLALPAGAAAAQGAERLPVGGRAATAPRTPGGDTLCSTANVPQPRVAGLADWPVLSATPAATSTIYLPLVMRNMIPCFYDDFSDPGSGWYVGAGSGWSIGYLNGEYQILLTENNTWAWGSPVRPLPNNYRIEVDARLTSNNAASYGLLFGSDEQTGTGYEFAVFPMEQAYVIVRYDPGGAWEVLEDEDYNPVIHAGTATNRLGIDRIGSSIHAYVNGVLVATWDDDSYTGTGLTYGLLANSYDEGAIDARFDNFSACPTTLTSPLYVEDFSVPGRWYAADHGRAQWSYQGEEYEILIRNTYSWVYATVPLEGGLPRFALEADMYFATSNLGGYGLNFDQVDKHHLYSFIVMPGSNQYGLWMFDTDTWTALVTWTASPAINPGMAINHLRVERDGEQIRLYANGVLLNSLSDASYMGNQEMSLYADSRGDVPVAARYDNVVFSELP